jgi:hemoglobin
MQMAGATLKALPRSRNILMTNFGVSLKLTLLTIGCLALSLAAAHAESRDGSLYSRLGGTPNVTAIFSDVIDRASHDPQLKVTFAGVNLGRVKGHIVEFICSLTGGGCLYSGDSMHDAHGGLGVTEAQFFELVTILRDSMRRHGVQLRERNELLQILAPMKRDIVER